MDVCKQHLDVCLGRTEQRVVNDASRWDELIAKCKDAKVDLQALEATGGYERGPVCALHGAGVTLARVNPRQAREFAESMDVLARTDQVDTRTLRGFADVLSRHEDRARDITPTLDEHGLQLAELMTRRHQPVDMRVAEGNHLEHAMARPSVHSIESVPKTMDRQLEAIDREVGDYVDREVDHCMDRHFKDQRALLDSVKGVGPVTILSLTAALPELGSAGRRRIFKPVGAAPLADDSGAAQGQAPHLGRPRQRACGGVPGRAGGDPAQPGDQGFSQPPDRRGQAQEGGHPGLHTQAADHPQRHARGPGFVERDKARAQRNGSWTSKTVADPAPRLARRGKH